MNALTNCGGNVFFIVTYDTGELATFQSEDDARKAAGSYNTVHGLQQARAFVNDNGTVKELP